VWASSTMLVNAQAIWRRGHRRMQLTGSWGRGPKEGDGLSATPSNLRFDGVCIRIAIRARSSKRLLTSKIRAQGPRRLPASDEVAEPMRVCVVGSGWRFLSGVSFYTCRMANALTEEGYSVSAILMRRLLPKRLYPGRHRVGASLSDLQYSPSIQVIDGVDYYWLPSIIPAIRHLWKARLRSSSSNGGHRRWPTHIWRWLYSPDF